MLKRFGIAGLLLAVSAIAPLTAAAQDRNYNNRSQAQSTSQHAVQGSYGAQDFRGRVPVRNTVVNRREPESNFRRDRDDRYARLRYDRDDFYRR